MKSKERGAALIVSLVLLVIGIMLALSGTQSARLEESMSGNHRAFSLALMAADTGASAWLANPSDPDPTTTPTCSTWPNDPVWSDPIATGDADPGGLTAASVGYEVVMCHMTGAAYRVKSRGEVYSNGEVVSYRDVVLEAFLLGPGFLNFSPINVASPFCSDDCVRAANSNLEVEGEFSEGDLRPAISAGSKENARLILDDILSTNSDKENAYFITEGCEDLSNDCNNNGVVEEELGEDMVRYECNRESTGKNKLCNYNGGVTSELGSAILEDPNLFAQFMEYAASKHSRDEEKAGEALLGSTTAGVTYVSDMSGADGMENQVVFVSADTLPESGGRHSFDGGGNFSGSGVLIIDGNVEFNGVPAFDGIIFALGDYVVSGSGGGTFNGAVVSYGYGCGSNDPSGCGKEEVRVSIGGGGSGSYLYDAEALADAFDLLSPEAQELMNTVDGTGTGDPVFVAQKWGEQIH